MSTQSAVAVDKMIFRKTNAHTGRHVAVTPANSSMRHLSYGRIILNSSKPQVSFSNGEQESGLICLSGNGVVKTAGNEYELGQFDAIYIPRDSAIEVTTKTSVDFAEFSADVKGKYPLKVVRYAEVSKDSAMKFATGSPGSRRELNVLIAKNVEAGRLLAGFTFSEPGHRIAFLWAMAAHKEVEDRQFGVVNIQPGFQQGSSGLEAARK